MVPAREAILRAREAFRAGVDALLFEVAIPSTDAIDTVATALLASAATRYPLPVVTKPRIVTDENGRQWRWTPEHGLVFRSSPQGEWKSVQTTVIVEGARKAVAGLLGFPTEEVEADA
jgi:hypothetical protein